MSELRSDPTAEVTQNPISFGIVKVQATRTHSNGVENIKGMVECDFTFFILNSV